MLDYWTEVWYIIIKEREKGMRKPTEQWVDERHAISSLFGLTALKKKNKKKCLTKQASGGIINIESKREVKTMERKTDYETMLEIFKRSGVKIVCMQDDYIEIEPETYGENVGFDFDSQGNFKKLL